MAPETRDLRLRCVLCEQVSERTVEVAGLHLTVGGEFVPIACDGCGARAMVPTTRPWALSFNDRTLLRQLRITAAD